MGDAQDLTQSGVEYLYEALDYAAKGKVKVVAETYKLDDIGTAYDRVAKGKWAGPLT